MRSEALLAHRPEEVLLRNRVSRVTAHRAVRDQVKAVLGQRVQQRDRRDLEASVLRVVEHLLLRPGDVQLVQ